MEIRSKFFTLVELLVVVAIIAMLAALLLPSLNKARNMSKKIKCISQLKQIGMGMSMYCNDFDSYVPGHMMSSTITDETLRWVTRLVPYSGDAPMLWVCPGAALENSDSASILQLTTYRRRLDTNFISAMRKVQTIGINAAEYTPTGDVFRRSFRYTRQKLGLVKNPSQVYYAGDAVGLGTQYSPNNPNGQLPIYGTTVYPSGGSALYAHHDNAINVLILDGHAESLSLKEAALRSAGSLSRSAAEFWITF